MNPRQTVPSQRLFRIISIILALYALIEFSDCITLVLMTFGVISNPYPAMIFNGFNDLLNNHPLWMLPVFLYFALLRSLSAYGLFRLRKWGFWTAILVCASTIFWAPFMMPLSGLEMLIDAAILFMLLLGYFGSDSIQR